MVKLVRVGSLDEIAPGDKKVVEVEGQSILIVNVNGKVYAVSNICTHEYAELANGFVVEDTVTCPLHLSRFRLDTGEVLNPPAATQLKTYKVVLQGNEIFLEI